MIDFSHSFGPVVRPSLVLYNAYLISFPGVTRPGRDVDDPLAPKIKKK